MQPHKTIFLMYAVNSLMLLLITVFFVRMPFQVQTQTHTIKNMGTSSMVVLSNATLQRLIKQAADANYIRAVFNTSFPTLPHKNSPLIPWQKKDKPILLVTKNKSTSAERIIITHCSYQHEDYFNQDMLKIQQTWFVCEKINNSFHWQVISPTSF